MTCAWSSRSHCQSRKRECVSTTLLMSRIRKHTTHQYLRHPLIIQKYATPNIFLPDRHKRQLGHDVLLEARLGRQHGQCGDAGSRRSLVVVIAIAAVACTAGADADAVGVKVTQVKHEVVT